MAFSVQCWRGVCRQLRQAYANVEPLFPEPWQSTPARGSKGRRPRGRCKSRDRGKKHGRCRTPESDGFSPSEPSTDDEALAKKSDEERRRAELRFKTEAAMWLRHLRGKDEVRCREAPGRLVQIGQKAGWWKVDESCEQGEHYAKELATRLTEGDKSDADLRTALIDALALMGKAGRTHAWAVARCTRDEEWKVRGAAALALANMGDTGRGYASAVACLLDDNFWGVRGFAAKALGNMGEPGARFAEHVIEYLMDKELEPPPFALMHAIDALTAMGKAAVPFASKIVEHLDHKEAQVRRAVVCAIPKLGLTAKYRAKLEEIMKADKHWEVRGEAATAIMRMDCRPESDSEEDDEDDEEDEPKECKIEEIT